jgi:hypothetical protein
VDDNSRQAMRIGVLLKQPFGDQHLDSVVQIKVQVSPNHVLSPLITGWISNIGAEGCKLHFREDRRSTAWALAAPPSVARVATVAVARGAFG